MYSSGTADCLGRANPGGEGGGTDDGGSECYSRHTAKDCDSSVECDLPAECGGKSFKRSSSASPGASRSLGLRVAVCDVNIGAATAAGLICKYVLPHMKRACVCRCAEECAGVSSGGLDRGKGSGSGISIDKGCEDTSTSFSTSTSNNGDQHSIGHSDTHSQQVKCSCCGYIVLTLKLVKNAKDSYIKRAVDSACELLSEEGCWDYRVVHLGANSRNERTLVCRYGGRGRREG